MFIMHKDVSGVRIIPEKLAFLDTHVNTTYTKTITVKNVSSSSKSIRYYAPQTAKFKLKVKNPEIPVAPGLEVAAVVEYKTKEAVDAKDRVVVTVDGDVIEVPLFGEPAKPNFELQTPADFGNVVLAAKTIYKEILLKNKGAKAGNFKITYAGDEPLSIIPSSGTVQPHSEQPIRVEYVTRVPGNFCAEAIVELQGQKSMMLPIKGCVVERTLELLDENKEKIECLRFGATYYGTDKTEWAYLYNNSPEPVNFICMLDENAVGQELGVDLTMSTAATLAQKMQPKNPGELNPMNSLFSVVPNEGVLNPYDRMMVCFRFSPRWTPSKQGFACSVKPPPRQDFAIFMRFLVVGAKDTLAESEDMKGHRNKPLGDVHAEVAIVATALPVLLSVTPTVEFDFGDCPLNERIDTLCTVTNNCSILPVTYQFRRIAHFRASPATGKIKPGKSENVIFSFQPNQIGNFKMTQFIDVLGEVADYCNPFLAFLEVISSTPIKFIAKCDPEKKQPRPKLNPGITPLITNEVGINCELKFPEGDQLKPKAALASIQTKKLLQGHKSAPPLNRGTGDGITEVDDDSLIAFPNDRFASIRPTERRKRFKTIFRKFGRHNFVDPDYAYTDEEMAAIEAHKNYYRDFINDIREERREKARTKEHKQFNDDLNIGIKVAAGLKPRRLSISDIKDDPRPPTPPNSNWKLTSSKQLEALESKNINKPVCEGLKAIPQTDQEKKECTAYLTPSELHKVVIGPAFVDFGDICIRSVNEKHLNIVNNLESHIHIQVSIDCRELRQTSPLSQVIPPMSRAVVPIIFESATKGRFQRSINYSINGFYKNHVTVTANVVPPTLELSTQRLDLTPTPGLPAHAGIRSTVTLHNPLNYAAQFTWFPIVGERGTAFSIRPASGTVDAFQDLDCEVVFHPSYLAPETGSFSLKIHGGESQHFECSAKLGSTNVQFIERRVMFGVVPLNITTTKTAVLFNGSSNHAYYKVLDPAPFQGLLVTPVQGVVPVGGKAELKIVLSPNALIKFDTRIQVAIRGWKTLELRVGGSVEPPCVDIDLTNFHLGGVACGSIKRQEFQICNRTKSKARCVFDLTRYKDFSLEFPSAVTPEDLSFQGNYPGRFTVSLFGEETTTGYLIFNPTEVAAYDFVLPVTINAVGAPTPSQTPVPPTPAPSNKNTIHNIINPKPIPVTIATPKKRVIATALRQPLQISADHVKFTLHSDYYESAADGSINHSQLKKTILANVSDRNCKWSLALDKSGQAVENGYFRFVRESGVPFLTHNGGGVNGQLAPGETFELGVFFCPEKSTTYKATVPILLDDNPEPVFYLNLSGELEKPVVTFEPANILLSPVPLGVAVNAELKVTLSGYRKPAVLNVRLPEVECDDGSLACPLVVRQQDGSDFSDYQIKPSDNLITIILRMSFESDRPLSFNAPVVLEDSLGNIYPVNVTATADNCLLTCYPFIAQHRLDHQIVCQEGKVLRSVRRSSTGNSSVGDPVITSIASPNKSRPSTSATMSQFEVSSSSYESEATSQDTVTLDLGANRAGAVNKAGKSDSNADAVALRQSLGSAVFPDEQSDEGIFHQEVMSAVQRWFSAHGWPGGAYPIKIPETLRNGVTKQGTDEGKSNKSDANNLRKDLKTIYDMVLHLAGRPIPGIPMNGPLPKDPTERVKQVYWQHNTMLTFIRNQGGCVASVNPENLMEPTDYKHWKWLKELEEAGGDVSVMAAKPVPTEEEVLLSDSIFDAISMRCWTDVLLQLWKTLVLSRITPRHLKHNKLPDKELPLPDVNVDPLCSNIYTVAERIVLTWMNHLFTNYKERIWHRNTQGGIPPSRWLVNFDFDLLDGLVFAACLGAYCPFLIATHLNDMYTKPANAEQCLHNALKVVNAIQYIGLDYDIQGIDITDPNPVSLLMLSVYLYQTLPLYIPKSTVYFTGTLHQPVQRQIKLTNPSGTKPLVYQAIISGFDADDFHVGSENGTITIPPKGQVNVCVEFKSRFLRPAEAVLILVGQRIGSASGTTMVFKLSSQVDNVTPMAVIKEESPCYELHKIDIEVNNPFHAEGEFRIVLVETMDELDSMNSKKGSSAAPKLTKIKKKKVHSKTDHGQRTVETPSPLPQEATNLSSQAKNALDKKKGDDIQSGNSKMSAFFCPADTVYLKAQETRTLQLHFLPFNMGKYNCSVILMNADIGEFLYTVEAKAVNPKVSALPFKPGPHSVRISSAAAASRGLGHFGGRDDVIYWKCEEGQLLEEVLIIPMTNIRREEALITAAHQQMNEMEYERRRVTGTLNSSTITTKAVELLTVGRKLQHDQKQPRARHHRGTKFKVTLSSNYFSSPSTITMPHPSNVPAKSNNATQVQTTGMVLDDGTIELPIKFTAEKSGHYPCSIILEAPDDIRVYQVECTVNPPGCSAQIEVNAPVHQSVVQNIPIINTSKHDWLLEAKIDGMGFFGPPSLIAKAMQVTTYPLTFRPAYEATVDGCLTLENKADCHEHIFDLIGKATEPLPLDKIVIKGAVNRPWSRIIDVPNITKKKLVYRIETDLHFLGGRPVITVLEGQLGKYELTALPKRRGKCSGAVAFVAGKNPLVQYDSDGDEIVGSDNEDDEYNGYKVWYNVTCDIAPAPAERNIAIKCNCQKRAVVEIGVNNPTSEDIDLVVEIHGMGLSGDKHILVPAKGKATYELIFFPTCIGETKGSIIFYHDATGEFWYDLNLIAENPSITNLPVMSCELGRWTQQMITLTNPTTETLEFVPTISNANNFSLERDDQRPIIIKPGATVKVPLNFMPSSLGDSDHKAKITFHSEQFGEWVFTACGVGTLPQPQDAVSLSSPAGANTTVIIPFRNPFDTAVNVDVSLADKEVQYQKIFNPQDLPVDSPFRLLLKKAISIRVGPKSTLDIPISFAPEEMRMFEALCVITVKNLDGSPWKYVLPNTPENTQYSLILPNDELHEIRWLYPIHGVTEAIDTTAKSAIIQCQARCRVEERLEVTLTGVAPSAAGQSRSIRARAVTPKGSDPTVPDGVVVAEAIMVAKQFTFYLEYLTAEQNKALEHCVVLSLVRQHRDSHSGLVTLVFNIVYAPYVQMRHDVMLVIKSATGGIWKFPIRFVATEPLADDVINIKSVGLSKTSSVGIRLTSQNKAPAPYQAYMLANSDPEFSVTPAVGELPPIDNQGALLIVSFTPAKYGKVYRGKLVVQTSDMQWTYEIVGTLPEYTPPNTQSAKQSRGLIDRSQRRNFVLDNLKLNTTAVSSPIKGAPVLQRRHNSAV